MNINQPIKKFFDKWPSKIICVVLAIFLYIFHQVSLVDKKTFVVPLKVVESGMMIHGKELPSSVSVIVRANNDVINTISSNDIRASIYLNPYTENGNFEIPVELSLSDKILAYDPLEVKVKPEYINVRIEKKVLKNLKIEPSIVGEVAHGYEIKDISVSPQYVEAIGPESIIEKITSINTTRVTVSNAVTDFATEADYLPVNNLISIANKGPYRVTISVQQSIVDKTLENVAILPLSLSKNLKLTKELPSVNVKISGTLLNLEKYSPAINALSVDFTNIVEPGIYELPVKYSFPYFVLVNDREVESVTVEVGVVDAKQENLEDNVNDKGDDESSEEESGLEEENQSSENKTGE